MTEPLKTLPHDALREQAADILRQLLARGVTPRGVSGDSRQVRAGDVFLAYPGRQADGRSFIADAVARGAVAVLCEADGKKVGAGDTAMNCPVPCLAVANLAMLAGSLAHLVYGQPSAQLWLAGVTGTNGKTSVSQWLMQALTQLGQRCAVIGTLGNGFPHELQESGFTTPDAPGLHAALADFVVQGATACAMEVSSIGLAEGRVNGVLFDVAIFTNLTRDHLDYHGTLAAYGEAKARLFNAPGLAAAVLNLDDGFSAQLLAALRGKIRIIGYTLDEKLARPEGVDELLVAENLGMTATGLHFDLNGQPFAAPVLGRFNAANLLAVIGALLARGDSLAAIADAVQTLQPPPGRLQALGGKNEPQVVVDYAHSPDALDKVLTALREVAAARGGRLVCVFGCGGDRDAGKRPQMGAVAERLADVVVVTSDNPRHEDAQAIIDDILAGMQQPPVVEAERGRAIADVIANAAARDVILLAGKGHETYQEIAGVRHPFADADIAKSALAARRTAHLSSLSGGCVT